MLKFLSEKILKTRMICLGFCPEKETGSVVKISSRICEVQVHIFAFSDSDRVLESDFP